MGITGLIPFLEKSSKKANISQFSGGTAAVDTYCWLHKGAFSCADKLAMGQPTDAYVKYCMKFVNMLIAANIKPILVFDGRHLPAKAETEVKRRDTRHSNRKRAAELMRMGKTAEARNMLKRSLDITHKMAVELIKECQQQNVDCIVAPYEADSQLAYLNISNIADVIITEDSDLTLFGCKQIFFKMDINGNGLLVEQERLHLAMGLRADNFNMDKFRYMCILSGCDYLSSLPGIGLNKACKFVCKMTECDIEKALVRLNSYLNMKSLNVTTEYIEAFIRAFITFKHQLVYCPLKRKQVRLYSPTPEVTKEQLKFAGDELKDEEVAWQMALGNYDPFTLEQFNDFDPDKVQKNNANKNAWAQQSVAKHVSIWSKDFKTKKQSESEDKNTIINLPDTVGQVVLLKSEACIKKKSTSTTATVSSRKRSYEEFQDISDGDLLNLYSNNSKDKITSYDKDDSMSSGFVETEQEFEETISPVLSPSLSRRRNPFKKQANDDSPSFLNKGRKRAVMRFKPTVIDETVIVQSKFFTKSTLTLDEEITKETNEENESKENMQDARDDDKTEQMIDLNDSSSVNVLTDNISNGSFSIKDDLKDSLDFLAIHKKIESEESIQEFNSLNTAVENTEEEVEEEFYCSMEEIGSKSQLFNQWKSPRFKSESSPRIENKQSIRNQPVGLKRRKSGRSSSQGSKKSEAMPGQSLLSRFGFQKK